MTDKIAIVVTLVIAGIVLYTMAVTMAKFDDPRYMCESTLGEEWSAANVTPAEGWACEHPNGTVETVTIQNVTSAPAPAMGVAR